MLETDNIAGVMDARPTRATSASSAVDPEIATSVRREISNDSKLEVAIH
jgi:hypothetical protein